jgi:hypothetical protein
MRIDSAHDPVLGSSRNLAEARAEATTWRILEQSGRGRRGTRVDDRRDFLKKAGKVAVTVPAVALLLSANTTPAQAANRYGKSKKKSKGKSKGKGKGKKK